VHAFTKLAVQTLVERTTIFDLHRGQAEIVFKAVVLPQRSTGFHSPIIDLHIFFLQFESDFSIIHKSMAFSIKKALPNLSKLEPLNGASYKHWSQKLLIFFEQLEVD